jgi:hypothetical protein
MKVKIPLGLLLMMATMLGYLLGTEDGRQKRDSLISKIRREEAIEELAEAVGDAVTEAAATEAAATED